MKAIFVNGDEYPFPELLATGFKTAETRSKRMLSALVGESDVAIVETSKKHKPMIIGYVDVTEESYCKIDDVRDKVLIPKGSKFDAEYKWCYFVKNAIRVKPYPLPENAVRHGRSWCEF